MTTLSRRTRCVIVWATAAAIALAAGLAPPFTQLEAYHAFADQRPLLGIPNFLDVSSNLAFFIVGAMGLRVVLRGTRANDRPTFEESSERVGWGVVFAATALTFFGSAYYHLAPDSRRLAWDRLPMAIGFMGIVSTTVSERVSATAGRRLLLPLMLLGAASVWYWRWSATHGVENLNPYAAVQFGSALVVLVTIALFPSRYTRGGDLVVALGVYGLAKVAEQLDRAIFVATGESVSGHTLKHLLAAVAMGWLVRMLVRRGPVSVAPR